MPSTLAWPVSVGLLSHLVVWVCSEPSINLQPVRLPNGNVELQCIAVSDEVEGALIRLGCDIRGNKVCRENCTLVCPLTDGQPNCTGLADDGVVGCRYSRLSGSTIKNAYELGSAPKGARANFWCIYKGLSSSTFTQTPPVKKSGRVGALSRQSKLKSAQQVKEIEHPNPGGDAAKLQKRFTTEVVFIIALCTVASCLLNLVFCLCCQMSRKYLNRLAKGSARNPTTEACLCLKSLADTYSPRDLDTRRRGWRGGFGYPGGSFNKNPEWSFRLPLSEPTPRRKPLTALVDYASYHPEPSCAHPDSPQQSPDEVIYDDVHQSTIYLGNGESTSQQNLACEGHLPSISSSMGGGQRCVVDQNGMLYLALGHVSNTPQSMRANFTGSRVTLSTFQPEASPKLDHQIHSPHHSSRSGLWVAPTNHSLDWSTRKESTGALQKPFNLRNRQVCIFNRL